MPISDQGLLYTVYYIYRAYYNILEYYIGPIYNIGLLLYIIHIHCTISFCTVQKHCKLKNIGGFKFMLMLNLSNVCVYGLV